MAEDNQLDKHRKQRLRRIESIDQKRLDASITELQQCNQTLETHRQLRASMQHQLDNSMEHMQNVDCLVLKNQSTQWATRTQGVLAQLDAHLKSLEEDRDQLLQNVRRLQAKVNGWELLLERIETEEFALIQKEAMYEADDRVLSELAVKNRNSK